MFRILVTGGAGFIGSHLVDKLISEGHQVTVVDNLSNGSLENLEDSMSEIEFRQLDVNIMRTMPQEIWDRRWDVIYHLVCFPRSASFDKPQSDVETNVLGMVNTLELARKHHSRVIFSSNSGMHDMSRGMINEDSPFDPKTPYDLDKLFAEHYIHFYKKYFNIPYTIFRFTTVYGPRQKLSLTWKPVVLEFMDKISKYQPIKLYGDGSATRDFIYVKDLVDALVASLKEKKTLNKTYILGVGKSYSILQLIENISKMVDKRALVVHESERLGEIKEMSCDVSKIKRDLGWEPKTSFKDGLKETYDWLIKER